MCTHFPVRDLDKFQPKYFLKNKLLIFQQLPKPYNKDLYLKCHSHYLTVNQDLISTKKKQRSPKIFQTLSSFNISHFISLAAFQKVDAQFRKSQVSRFIKINKEQ